MTAPLPLVVLRPQPGNDATAARAIALGLEAIQLPLFEVMAVAHDPVPPAGIDGVLLTSANGARHGAALLAACAGLPAYAVGEASAAAARAAGCANVIVGGGDAASTVAKMARAGHRHVLHIGGAEVRPFDPCGLAVERRVVYRTAPTPAGPIRAALDGLSQAVLLIHAPSAGRRIAELVDHDRRAAFALVAISAAAAQPCGECWQALELSRTPDDTALLSRASALCNEVR